MEPGAFIYGTLIYGTFIYAGYVDDRRNTDSAWIETFVVQRHIDGPIPI